MTDPENYLCPSSTNPSDSKPVWRAASSIKNNQIHCIETYRIALWKIFAYSLQIVARSTHWLQSIFKDTNGMAVGYKSEVDTLLLCPFPLTVTISCSVLWYLWYGSCLMDRSRSFVSRQSFWYVGMMMVQFFDLLPFDNKAYSVRPSYNCEWRPIPQLTRLLIWVNRSNKKQSTHVNIVNKKQQRTAWINSHPEKPLGKLSSDQSRETWLCWSFFPVEFF